MDHTEDERRAEEHRALVFGERIAQLDRDEPGFAAAFARLATRLLVAGGSCVVPVLDDPHMLDEIAESGVEFGPSGVVIPMEASQCHRNALVRWYRSQGAELVWTGWALSDDGLWRRHSWCVAAGRVVETTVARQLYVGVERSFEECAVLVSALGATGATGATGSLTPFGARVETAVREMLRRLADAGMPLRLAAPRRP